MNNISEKKSTAAAADGSAGPPVAGELRIITYDDESVRLVFIDNSTGANSIRYLPPGSISNNLGAQYLTQAFSGFFNLFEIAEKIDEGGS